LLFGVAEKENLSGNQKTCHWRNQGRRHLFSKKLGIYSEKWLKFPFIFKEKRPHNSSTKKESTSHFWEIFFLLQSVAIFDKKNES
jgi:hypothetical protein